MHLEDAGHRQLAPAVVEAVAVEALEEHDRSVGGRAEDDELVLVDRGEERAEHVADAVVSADGAHGDVRVLAVGRDVGEGGVEVHRHERGEEGLDGLERSGGHGVLLICSACYEP